MIGHWVMTAMTAVFGTAQATLAVYVAVINGNGVPAALVLGLTAMALLGAAVVLALQADQYVPAMLRIDRPVVFPSRRRSASRTPLVEDQPDATAGTADEDDTATRTAPATTRRAA